MNWASVTPFLLFFAAFTLATILDPLWSRFQRQQAHSVVDVMVGDGKRLFSDYFITKADVYFHNGYYPSMFDRLPNGASHPEESAEEHGEHHDEHDEAEHERQMDFLGQSQDWIETFGRNFFVSKHTHMQNADSKELLPWFKVAAELDPHRVETYTTTAFWLRSALHKVDEAEQFLRDGWKENPDSYAILLELGRLYESDRKDYDRARNVFELALKKWDAQEKGKEKPDEFAREQILGHLANLEETRGNLQKSLEYLRQLEPISPDPATIRKRIAELEQKLRANGSVR